MKRILLLSILGLCAFSVKAQYFNQNFLSSTTLGDYVDGAPASRDNNKFTHSWAGASTIISIATVSGNNKLRISRTGAGTTNDNVAGIVRSSNGGAGVNGNFAATAPKFLKVSFEFTITAVTNGGANYNANMCFVQIGNALSTTSVGTPYAEISSSTRKDDGSKYIFSRPVSVGAIGTGDDRTTEFTGTQQISWYLNNTGNDIAYTGADGNPHTLANDTWDLFIGGVLVMDDRAATNPNMDMQNIGFTFRGLQLQTTLDIDDIDISSPTYTLPVNLISFTGKSTTNGNLLEWKTASESNNSHFEVLRSTDGKTFSTIGKVNGKGNSSELSIYSFTDSSPLMGISYYKLKQVDFDGASKESEAVAVASSLEPTKPLLVNSKDGNLQMSFYAPKNGNAEIRIYDLNGKKLLNKQANATQGLNTLNYPLSLNKGVYVGYVNVDGSVLRTKFYH